MRYPACLQPNGTIGTAAPSFGAGIEPYQSMVKNAFKKFREAGYRLDPGKNTFRSDGIGISAPPAETGEELTRQYLSDKNDVLIAVGGGELMCETLDHVDFDALKEAAPKWYCGYSDNTNFTFLSATLLDTAAIYGPCLSDFGMEPWHPSIRDAFGLLTGETKSVEGYDLWEKKQEHDLLHPLAPYAVTEKSVPVYEGWDGSVLRGRLIGGCLDCLVYLCGTKYDRDFSEKYREDGFLWFLESCDLNVFGIRRALWQLKNAGWFSGVRAFLIGRPLVMGQEMMGLDQYNAVTGMLSDFGVPILMDLDIGHLSPMMPLVTGALAEVSKNEKGLVKVAFNCR